MAQKLILDSQMATLIANGKKRGEDHKPVIKLFNPVGAATWLISEIDEDGDTMFGLCDLGFGCPELGSVSLRELKEVRLPLGMKIERDMHFTADRTITQYADKTRADGSIRA